MYACPSMADHWKTIAGGLSASAAGAPALSPASSPWAATDFDSCSAACSACQARILFLPFLSLCSRPLEGACASLRTGLAPRPLAPPLAWPLAWPSAWPSALPLAWRWPAENLPVDNPELLCLSEELAQAREEAAVEALPIEEIEAPCVRAITSGSLLLAPRVASSSATQTVCGLAPWRPAAGGGKGLEGSSPDSLPAPSWVDWRRSSRSRWSPGDAQPVRPFTWPALLSRQPEEPPFTTELDGPMTELVAGECDP
mmetsp:Transcript_37839/g.117639  ORF Transcript_37839/g.117639 Transcript_37839/m.117639 type:complete len:256 (-) Transcript_37839:678-1445(-)